MIKQSKITVKHYLNTDLKPIKSPLGNEFKIYFLLRYLNQNTKIKSLISNTLTESEYNEIDNDNIINKWQTKEVNLCETTIKALEKCNYPFDIKTFMQFYEFAKYPILENFINFIDWQKTRLNYSFSDFYEKTNYQNQLECLLNLKKIIYNNEKYINNEIHLGNLKIFKKELSIIKINIYESIKEENKNVKESFSFTIETKYQLKKYNFLDYFTEKILKENLYRLPKLDILPPKLINDNEFLILLINSFISI